MEWYARYVWTKVDAEGKPSEPPRVLPSSPDNLCGQSMKPGCYYGIGTDSSVSHSIWVYPQNFEYLEIEIIDHELTHALLRNDPTIGACLANAADVYAADKSCSHGDTFKEKLAEVESLFADYKSRKREESFQWIHNNCNSVCPEIKQHVHR